MSSSEVVHIVGGGLAGSEAAWQLAERGHDVVIHEMRGVRGTPAHKTERLAELVCSNTFKSTETSNAHGLLKAEMRLLGSVVLWAADQARVPGGTALAVDRDVFSSAVHDRVTSHPRISVVREEVTALAESRDRRDWSAHVRFACRRRSANGWASRHSRSTTPSRRSSRASRSTTRSSFRRRATTRRRSARRGEGGAYLNCPFTREQYEAFLDALIAADQHHGHEFDEVPYFEGCMPAEEIASRGRDTLRFGPMKPVGLRDPRTGREAHAIAQLRMEDRAGRMWNIVGFQTRLRIPEQQRVFRLIPGLENAEFLRYGSIHRNSYVNSPATLTPHLSARDDDMMLFAGQLTGVEGYTESTATGLLAGINLSRMLAGERPVVPPPTTMLGALYRYLREADPKHFQPMNANFGLVDDLPARVKDKRVKREQLAERALR